MVISKCHCYTISGSEQLVNKILAQGADIIEKKYRIHCCGTGAAMPEGIINKFMWSFDIYGALSREKARIMLIDCADEISRLVKNNKEISKYLRDYPFTINNVQIILYMHDAKGFETYDPDLATAQILRGTLSYRTNDQNNIFRFKTNVEESYEEALKIIESASNSS